MSMDFIFAVVKVPNDDSQTDRVLIESRLESISEQRLIEVAEWTLGWYDDFTADEVIAAAGEALEYANSDANDFGWFRDSGNRYLVTGGMSGGDDPTEAFRHFRLLDELGIMDDDLWEDN